MRVIPCKTYHNLLYEMRKKHTHHSLNYIIHEGIMEDMQYILARWIQKLKHTHTHITIVLLYDKENYKLRAKFSDLTEL